MSETSTKTSDVYLAPTNIEPMTKEQLAEISNLIKECTNFVDTTKKTLSIPFAAFERVRQWRVKRRESKAMELCDTLIPRVKTVEVSECFTILLVYSI